MDPFQKEGRERVLVTLGAYSIWEGGETSTLRSYYQRTVVFVCTYTPIIRQDQVHLTPP